MFVLGIDPGLTTVSGIAIAEERTNDVLLHHTEEVLPASDWQETARAVLDALDVLLWYPHATRIERWGEIIGCIAVEWPHVRNAQKALQLAAFCGQVMHFADDAGIAYALPSVQDAKEALTGYRLASKSAMRTAAKTVCQLEEKPNEHVADAIGVARAGYGIYLQNRIEGRVAS